MLVFVSVPLDIFTQFEAAATGLDLGHCAWTQLVHQLAEDDAVLEDVLVATLR